MNNERQLPAQFAELEPFATPWGSADTAEGRYLLRNASSMAELRSFYDAITPRIEAVLNYLDQTPFDARLNEADQRLYCMALSLIEVAEAIEVFDQPNVPLTEQRHHVKTQWNRDA
jgi:hypothetical protein